ncbi:hypothetical protein [Mycobacterium sp. TY815]|uniref:hypothetical protein n=1 Tax=Mycobacterium sp. TY815 TaxID=3050581 RepID=UPI00274095B2|nr:hypothetical protein [Mycobacterium sp. TY815]MDP7707481.1 hypothetical protein [Mycobacterium sp. TY815]
MTTADTIRLREALLNELRKAHRPVSTAELAALMPWRVERTDDTCALLCQHAGGNKDVEVLECHGSWHVVQYRRTSQGYSGIYRHLRSLEQQRIVRRTLHDGRKRVCWSLVVSETSAGLPADQGDRG